LPLHLILPRHLITVAGKHRDDLMRELFMQDFGATQHALAFVRLARCQVACACLAMLDLAGGGRAESFLNAFMSLLLGHGYLLRRTAFCAAVFFSPRYFSAEFFAALFLLRGGRSAQPRWLQTEPAIIEPSTGVGRGVECKIDARGEESAIDSFRGPDLARKCDLGPPGGQTNRSPGRFWPLCVPA